MNIPPPPPSQMSKPNFKMNGFSRSYPPPPPPPPPLCGKTSSRNSSNKPAQGRVELLGDIHKGVKLKSSKHLMNDRSGLFVAETSSGNKSSSSLHNGNSSSSIQKNVSSLASELSKINLKSHRISLHDIRQPSTNVNKEQSRPITSELNNGTSTQRRSKPPILHPKPKLSIPSSFSHNNLSGDLIPNGDVNLKSKDLLGRKSSVDISNCNSHQNISSARPFATMSRTNGKKIARNCFDQSNNTDGGVQSFQQNRMLISSLFDNGSSGNLEMRRSSVVNFPADVCDNDRSSGNSQNSSLSSTSIVSNDMNTSGKFSTAFSVEKGFVLSPSLPTISNPNLLSSRRASRPLPPVPLVSKAYPDKLQRAQVTNQQIVPELNPVKKSNFEQRFHFHEESYFPKPRGFVAFKKFYPSKSWKNPINQFTSSVNATFTKLVTTV